MTPAALAWLEGLRAHATASRQIARDDDRPTTEVAALTEPLVVPWQESFGGCKSWVEL